MHSLRLQDQYTYSITNSVDENAIRFNSTQLDIFIRSGLSQKKNVLFIKTDRETSNKTIEEILESCYQNKEKLQCNSSYCFIPQRLKKLVCSNDKKINWLSSEISLN